MSELTNVSYQAPLSLATVLADLAAILYAGGTVRPVGPQLRAMVQEALREETYGARVPLPIMQPDAVAG